MQNYTLSVPDNSNKASALLNYLKTLDFIKISKSVDWWDELSQENINNINKGLDDLENGNTHTDEDVRKNIHQRIINAQTK